MRIFVCLIRRTGTASTMCTRRMIVRIDDSMGERALGAHSKSVTKLGHAQRTFSGYYRFAKFLNRGSKQVLHDNERKISGR